MLKHWRVPFTHFFLPVFFGFFLRLVFLPFAIFGSPPTMYPRLKTSASKPRGDDAPASIRWRRG